MNDQYTLSPQILRIVRTAAGLSQCELAAMIGVDRSNLSRFETGARRISPEIHRRLVLALGLNESTAFNVIRAVQAYAKEAGR